MNYPVKHSFSLGVILLALWLGMSGKFTVFMLCLGLASILAVLYIAHRMDVIDQEKYPAHINVPLLRFWLYLSREVVIANIDVVRRIFTPGKSISPQMFELPQTLKTDLSCVIYANAITLTPGTVSVNLNKESITVHSLSKEAMKDLCSGRMASLVPEDYKDE